MNVITTTLGPSFVCLHTGKLNDWDLHPFKQESAVPEAWLGEVVFPNLQLILQHDGTGELAYYYVYVNTRDMSWFKALPIIDMESVIPDIYLELSPVWVETHFVSDYRVLGVDYLPDESGYHPEAITLQKGLYIRPPVIGEHHLPRHLTCMITMNNGTMHALPFPLVELYSHLCGDDKEFWDTVIREVGDEELTKVVYIHLKAYKDRYLPGLAVEDISTLRIQLSPAEA